MDLTRLDKLLAPLRRRLDDLVGRALVKLVTEGNGLQWLQVEIPGGEVRDQVRRVQEFGFVSNPKPADGDTSAAFAVLLFPGGFRGNPIAIAVDDPRYRPTDLQGGESAVYNAFGVRLTLKADGSMVARNGGGTGTLTIKPDGSMEVTASPAKITGDLQVTGKITATANIEAGVDLRAAGKVSATGNVETAAAVKATGNVESLADVKDVVRTLAADRVLYNAHNHVDNVPPGPTGPPVPLM